MKIKLELPNLKYKESFLAGMKETESEKYENIKSDEDFQQLVVQPKLDHIIGKNLPDGHVPGTDYWIIEVSDNGEEEYAGRMSLRHELSESLLKRGGHIGYAVVPSKRGNGYAKAALRLALEEARKRGIQQALITCFESNEASRRIIVDAFKEYGGKEDVPTKTDDGAKMLRFWINTSKIA